MPIKDKTLYPSEWETVIRPAVLERAKNRCEQCGVPNYAVGHRDAAGRFHPTGGNEWHDKAAMGELPYSEAVAGVRHLNECGEGLGPNGERGIVIVLTVAHWPDPDPANGAMSNLLSLCQRCHNRLDIKFRQGNARLTREAKKRRLQPAPGEAG